LCNGGGASLITDCLPIGEIDRCYAGRGRIFSIFFSMSSRQYLPM
jgi:hypothetical protein